MRDDQIASGPGWRVYRSFGAPPLRHITIDVGTIDILEPVRPYVAKAAAAHICTITKISTAGRERIIRALLS